MCASGGGVTLNGAMIDPAILSSGSVLVGFALATGRDLYAGRLRRLGRDRSVLTAIHEEITANLDIATNNLALVRHERTLLPQGQGLVNPLDPLGMDFWDLVKLDPPRALLVDTAALANVRRVARLTPQVNEMMRTREAFRTSSPLLGMTMTAGGGKWPAGTGSWVPVVDEYDSLIENWLTQLIGALQSLQPAVRVWKSHP
ncbi:MAG: hypothetical protein QOF68_556 [Gaiellales bacterium]|nr:hypothetical protein [Gaiellales bacterium]